MQFSNEALKEYNKKLTEIQPMQKYTNGRVLRLGQYKKREKPLPLVTYQSTNNINTVEFSMAFDILFEETIMEYGNLTTNDN